MPKVKPSTNVLPHIRARVEDIRLMQEKAEFVTKQMNGKPIAINAVGRAELSIGLSEDPLPNKQVSIGLNFFLTLKRAEEEEVIVEYSNQYSITLIADLIQGVEDPHQHLPIESVQSYVEMIQRIATLRAQSTLLEMGLGGIKMPKPSGYEPKPSGEEPTKVKQRSPRKASVK